MESPLNNNTYIQVNLFNYLGQKGDRGDAYIIDGSDCNKGHIILMVFNNPA